MKRLIVNADDFGLTRGINRAIIECHQRGIVTSTTLMANSAAFDDAVRLAKENPGLSVGCHVTLLDGEPLLERSQVRSLLRDGKEFYRSITDFAPRALLRRFQADEIEAEATAQFRRIQQAGISISHFDAHKHAHMFPHVLAPLLRAAKACGVPALRNPFEQTLPMALSTLLSAPKLRVRYAEVFALRALRSGFLKLVRASGLRTTEGSVGVVATGTLNPSLIAEILHHLELGTWELVCHPGYADEDLARVHTFLQTERSVEKDTLQAEDTRELVAQLGIQLIPFHELATVAVAR